jgi:hypothetical protein
MSKIGVHVFIGPRKGYGEFLKKIAAAGQTLAVVKCVDDFGSAKEAKDLMPKTLTVGRLNQFRDEEGRVIDSQGFEPLLPDGTYRDAREVAEWYYERVRPTWEANPWIDVWETFNEFSAHWGWQGEFYMAMMDLVQGQRFRLAHYACSTGNPPNEDAVQQMIPCLRKTKQRGHYLSLHEYGGVGMPVETLKGTQPYHALRYRALYTHYLRQPKDKPDQWADPPLIISECAQSGGYQFVGTEIFIEDFAWYDSELMKDEYVVGGAAWTLGKTPLWPEANIQEALPALADYIISHPTVAPVVSPGGSTEASPFGEATTPSTPTDSDVEPTEPAKPADETGTRSRGAPRAQYKRTYLLLPNEPATPEGNQRLDQWIKAVVASGVLTRHRWTMGASADDAGLGDLDKRNVIAINPATWPTSLADFYANEYPGVTYDSVQAATPEELRTLLANMAFG